MVLQRRKRKAYASQGIGAAGELVVQAALLRRGWVAGNLNTGGMHNAPSVDIVAMKKKRDVRIAVKSCGPTACSQWNLKPGWRSLFKGKTKPDFLIFVWFVDNDKPDDARIFVVPANVAESAVRKAHLYWFQVRKRQPYSSHVAIWWLGRDTKNSIAREFARKWEEYENNWRLLERHAVAR